ncbi:protein FAR-RED IMPAIRED RESPONSE 1-like [Abrus precatorius]|uniref:Protein FAR1-RELATED SEQUENCE n=1 Tax=Abrus precatorius TaxID=3816 RepID=A0A8B8M8W2_ABRPR|nr:protein FAR-RED IMPAIRED RESPONSE 1-like [Abrus precatorius]
MHVRRTLDLHSEAGVRINKTFQTLVHDVGGHDNLKFVEKDVRNYINKERRLIAKEGDSKALVDYFCRMKEENSQFWYDIDVDEDFCIRNIFGQMLEVELHMNLLEISCMCGKAPNGIVTEQCKAIQNAIAIALPNTQHRWCLWHIMKKIPEILKGYGQYKQIKSTMKDVVYDSVMKDDFEEKWYSFLKKFDVKQNQWLCGLFKDRHRWVPIYLKQDFWAGLSTTQRSESVHAFFHGYLNSKTSLQQFVKQYDNTLKSKVEKEVEADFRTMNTTIQYGSNSLIERQFQAEYTKAKFAEVQAEFRGKMNCATAKKFEVGTIISYNVCEDFIFSNQMKEAKFEVIFNRESKDISCQCLLFEFRGIMCRHSLSVLGIERVKQISSKYIFSR